MTLVYLHPMFKNICLVEDVFWQSYLLLFCPLASIVYLFFKIKNAACSGYQHCLTPGFYRMFTLNLPLHSRDTCS